MENEKLLTDIHLNEYNTEWNVSSSDEFDVWFSSLDEDSKSSVYGRVLLLKYFGPNLPRPYADVLHGSKKYKNLKELRSQTERHILRISYYFDRKRNAFLLAGGDKIGCNQKRFYKNLIRISEKIIERHEKEAYE